MTEQKEPLFPQVKLKLTGQDGNAFSIISRVSQALRKANVETEHIQTFQEEAMSGDYNNVLRTVMKYIDAS